LSAEISFATDLAIGDHSEARALRQQAGRVELNELWAYIGKKQKGPKRHLVGAPLRFLMR